MENKQKLIYHWQVVLNMCPYLNLHELLSTATLSKQWNYMLKKYIGYFLLPQHLQGGDQFNKLKNLFNRKIYIYNSPTETIDIKTPYLIKNISYGINITTLQLLNGNCIVLKNSQLINRNISKIKIQLPKNYKDAKCLDQYLYCVDQHRLIRYKVMADQILANQEVLIVNGLIQYTTISMSHILVFTGVTNELTKAYAVNHKSFKLIELPNEKVVSPTDYHIGKNQCFLIQDQKVYTVDLQGGQLPQIFKPLQDKIIVTIKNGNNHFIAFERTKKLLKNWGVNQVIQWAQEQGFEDYIKIFKAQKITGKKLLTMNKSFMEDALGIINQKVQQKMFLRIAANNQENPDQYILHAWGNNGKGQLGNLMQLNVTNPMKLKLPENLEVYTCLGNYTFLKDKKTEGIYINSIGEQGNPWKVLTQSKIWNISTYKNSIIYSASQSLKKNSQAMSQEPLSKKKQKLRTAKNILDQILWDQNLSKQDFRVGYMDKYSGILQSSIEQLMSSQVKQYRIMYFKRVGQIVWDKTKRIDFL